MARRKAADGARMAGVRSARPVALAKAFAFGIWLSVLLSGGLRGLRGYGVVITVIFGVSAIGYLRNQMACRHDRARVAALLSENDALSWEEALPELRHRGSRSHALGHVVSRAARDGRFDEIAVLLPRSPFMFRRLVGMALADQPVDPSATRIGRLALTSGRLRAVWPAQAAVALGAVNATSAVLHFRGHYAESARLCQRGWRVWRLPEFGYNQACALARLGHRDEAVAVLEAVVRKGSSAAGMATDADLTGLHDHPDFQRLIGRSGDRSGSGVFDADADADADAGPIRGPYLNA